MSTVKHSNGQSTLIKESPNFKRTTWTFDIELRLALNLVLDRRRKQTIFIANIKKMLLLHELSSWANLSSFAVPRNIAQASRQNSNRSSGTHPKNRMGGEFYVYKCTNWANLKLERLSIGFSVDCIEGDGIRERAVDVLFTSAMMHCNLQTCYLANIPSLQACKS